MNSAFPHILTSFCAAIMLVFCSEGCACDSTSAESDTRCAPYSFTFDEYGRIKSFCAINSKDYIAIFDTGANGIILDSAQFSTLVEGNPTATDIIYYASRDSHRVSTSVSKNLQVGFCGKVFHFETFHLDNVRELFNADVLLPLANNGRCALHIDYEKRLISWKEHIPAEIVSTHTIQSDIYIDNGNLVVTLPFYLTDSKGEAAPFRLTGTIDTGSGGYLTAYGGLIAIDDTPLISLIKSIRPFHCITGDLLYVISQTSPFTDTINIVEKTDTQLATLIFGNALLSHYDIWLDLEALRLYARVNGTYVHPYNDYLTASGKNLFVTRTQEGTFVNCCSSSSPLWTLGLRSGDLILGKDNHFTPVLSSEDLRIFYTEPDKYKLYVCRDRDTITLPQIIHQGYR